MSVTIEIVRRVLFPWRWPWWAWPLPLAIGMVGFWDSVDPDVFVASVSVAAVLTLGPALWVDALVASGWVFDATAAYPSYHNNWWDPFFRWQEASRRILQRHRRCLLTAAFWGKVLGGLLAFTAAATRLYQVLSSAPPQ